MRRGRGTFAVVLAASAIVAGGVPAAGAAPGKAARAASAEPARGARVEVARGATAVTDWRVPALPDELGPGVHELTTTVDGIPRTWSVVVPPGKLPGVPAPLVVVLHGVGGHGGHMRGVGLEPLAARFGVVVAYPNGRGGAWNDGRPGVDLVDPAVEPSDELAFLRTLVAETAAQAGADPRLVSFVGFSNGAIMVNRVACDFGRGIRSAVLVDGSGGLGFAETCRPRRPLSVMVVADSGDRVVPYEGGTVAPWRERARGSVEPVSRVVEFWARRAGCDPLGPGRTVSADPPVTEVVASGCAGRAAVVHYRLATGQHEWCRREGFDTTAVVWGFVARSLGAEAVA